MAIRTVKLQDTGEYMSNINAYKAPNGKYYSSKGGYETIKHNSELRQMCIDEVKNQLGYEGFMIVPKLFLKKLKEWEAYTYDVIYCCILKNKPSVQWAINTKNFKSESNKIAYLCSIWENGLNDAYADYEREKKKENEIKLAKVDIDGVNVVSNINTTLKTNDVSNLVGDLWN